MNLFDASEVATMESTRSVGQPLGAVGYYGPQAGSDDMASAAADYATALADVVEDNLAGNGRVEGGAANQDIWVGNWGGDFYQGRGVPGKSDTPE
jgi:hypothetical protein